jgi:23S rRNA (cytidine2498-2'-O)-methyltransferase
LRRPVGRPSFLYCACQVGAEVALKQAVAVQHPGLRPAFARPGLVTWKAEGVGIADLRVDSPLARVQGESLGPARTPAELLAALEGRALGERPVLHVWERDLCKPGDEPPGFAYGPAAARVRAAIEAAWPAARPRAPGEAAAIGDVILDVIVAQGDEPWLVGLRRRRADEVPFPGGRIPVAEPAVLPSRAYYKLEEALVWSRAPVRAGDVAVELGSAPGGASWALLQRGVHVHGIDPGVMDPAVLEYCGPAGNRFTHHHRLMGQVERRELPRTLQWVLCDVNLAPQVAMQSVRRLAARPRAALCGVLVTWKLDDWKALRHLPRWRTQLVTMGMVETGVTQLPRNRMELFAYGLTAAGAARRSSADA